MSTSNRRLTIDSPAVTVLLDRITVGMGDDRLSQLIRQKLVEAFERVETSENEAKEKAAQLEDERASLAEKQQELESEQLALQEHQQALHTAAESLNALPGRVTDLFDQFQRLNDGVAEERQAASEAGSSFDKLETLATNAATALDDLKKQVETLTSISQGIATLSTTIGSVQTEQTGLVTQTTNVVNQVDHLAKAVGTVPTEASISRPTGLVAEAKSTSEALKTLATKADLEEWSNARTESQARSNEEAISECVKAALKDFQDSTVAEYSQKLQDYEAVEEEKREAFEDLRVKALVLENKSHERGQRLATLEKENEDLKLALQNRDRDLAGSSGRLEILTRDLSEAEARIGRRDTTISEAKARIDERDTTISEANARIDERDTAIAEANARIDERDTAIAEANALIGSKDTAIQKANELMESYKEAIKAKDAEMEKICARLRAVEAQVTMTQQPETQSSDMGTLEGLSQAYLKLSNGFRGIPTSIGSQGGTDMPELAVRIAPVLLRPQAQSMIREFLDSGAQGWHCLQQVADQGSQAESVPEGICALHQERCVLVQVLVSGERRILNFYNVE